MHAPRYHNGERGVGVFAIVGRDRCGPKSAIRPARGHLDATTASVVEACSRSSGGTNMSSLRHLKLFRRPQVLSKDLAQWRVASVSPFSLTSRSMRTS
jgi:hypothetical protein